MKQTLSLAVMQPYFIPYIGYFQLMAKVDTFVIYDDVTFINRGWINRNRINVKGVAHTLTVPLSRASQNKLICDIELSDTPSWRQTMIKTAHQSYAKAPYIKTALPLFETIVNCPAHNLSEFLFHSILLLKSYLQLDTKLVETSRCYGNAALTAQARIVDICLKEKSSCYVNPIGGQDLYEKRFFESFGLELRFLKPSISDYDTGRTPFVPALSVLDVLMYNSPEEVSEFVHAGTLLQ